MTSLIEKAFDETQKLPIYLQDELAQQLLEDIESELKWQATLSNPDLDLGILENIAREVLIDN